jgi:hypothetical protein
VGWKYNRLEQWAGGHKGWNTTMIFIVNLLVKCGPSGGSVEI